MSKNDSFTRVWTSDTNLGYLKRMTPQTGGYTAPAPALDLTTFLEVSCWQNGSIKLLV